MRFSRTHQSHAATCRHAPTQAIKARFWNDLDAQYENFLSSHKDTSIGRFCAIQRGRLRRMHNTLGVKLRTAESWLRAWSSNGTVSIENDHLGDAQ